MYGAIGVNAEPLLPLVHTGFAGVPTRAPLPMSQTASSMIFVGLKLASNPNSVKLAYSNPCALSIDKKSLSRKLQKVKGGGPGSVAHSELDAMIMGWLQVRAVLMPCPLAVHAAMAMCE